MISSCQQKAKSKAKVTSSRAPDLQILSSSSQTELDDPDSPLATETPMIRWYLECVYSTKARPRIKRLAILKLFFKNYMVKYFLHCLLNQQKWGRKQKKKRPVAFEKKQVAYDNNAHTLRTRRHSVELQQTWNYDHAIFQL